MYHGALHCIVYCCNGVIVKSRFFFLMLCVQEIRIKPRPIVFAAFSGGPKACLYKALQVCLSLFFIVVNDFMVNPYLNNL